MDMAAEIVEGYVAVTAKCVHGVVLGLFVLMRVALWAMTRLGTAMGVDPDRVTRDVAVLEAVGTGLCLIVSVNASAAIICAMGRVLQCHDKGDRASSTIP